MPEPQRGRVSRSELGQQLYGGTPGWGLGWRDVGSTVAGDIRNLDIMSDIAGRVSNLERVMGDIRGVLGRLEPKISEIHATIPHLATNAALAEKPGKGWIIGVVGLLFMAFTAALFNDQSYFSKIVAGWISSAP